MIRNVDRLSQKNASSAEEESLQREFVKLAVEIIATKTKGQKRKDTKPFSAEKT